MTQREPLGPASANSAAWSGPFGSPAKLFPSLGGEDEAGEPAISAESVAKNAARVIEALEAEVREAGVQPGAHRGGADSAGALPGISCAELPPSATQPACFLNASTLHHPHPLPRCPAEPSRAVRGQPGLTHRCTHASGAAAGSRAGGRAFIWWRAAY